MFKPVSPKVDFAALEEAIITYWKENKIFEKTLVKDSPKGSWTFLDGPPFVTGMPHYGSLLSSIPKDLFGRYWTMKGYHVRRVWGWDGHGLPIENKVENELGITRKKDIEEKVGVAKFIERCLHYVNQVSDEWEWYIDHIGRWADFKHAYKTWDMDYMESVMWVFKQMYEKEYIYKGLKVSLYCPHCSTPISNFEVAMDADNYKELSDASTTYKYQVANEENTFFLAWSTTPWTKITTSALAVNPKLAYVKVKQNNEFYILAKGTLKMLEGKYEIVEEFKGKELIGKEFIPHYDYYKSKVTQGEKIFILIPGDFVSEEEGTGIVTISPYGEEDLNVMQEQNVYKEMHLDEEGNVKKDVPIFGGMYYLKSNKAVNLDLKNRGLIYKDGEVSHRVPLCWRCHTRLYYAAIDAWYVNVQKMKDELIKKNEGVNWFPNHFKHGRFLKSLESAPDWNISRNRYWGSPVPVWDCKECGERFVPGSIKELEEASEAKVKNLHKPDIDEVTITCKKCGKKVNRVAEVLDSWIEAGSASFAERHYPFASLRVHPESSPRGVNPSEELKEFFPPDFITEYTGQIRAWFYVLHVIANALYKSQAFKNVLVTGVILGTDGRKMSKNFKNYPDPKDLLQKYGGDALRLYLLSTPVMRGEDILISEEQYKLQVRGMMLILWNVYNFFVSNANVDKYQISNIKYQISKNVLDQWIISLLHGLMRDVTDSLEKYDTVLAIEKIQTFIDDLSTWYIRRSRDRVGPTAQDEEDKHAFYETCFYVLTTLCKILAPIAPFISEEIYRNLTNEESVHLATWPIMDEKRIDKKLIEEMENARKVVEMVHADRKVNNLKLRQPLEGFSYSITKRLREEIESLIKDETNVKSVRFELKEVSPSVVLNRNVTPELKAEGEARDIIRAIQAARKELGVSIDSYITVILPAFPKQFENEIKRQTLAKEIKLGDTLVVELVK